MIRFTLALVVGALLLSQPASAAFPGPEGPIVFSGDPAHGAASLFTLRDEALSPFAPSSTQQSAPAYSADGRWVAYAEARDLWVVRADGKGAPRQVTDDAANDTDPAFSPDGRRLVFSRGTVGAGDLFVVGIDGRGLRNLSNDPQRIDDAPAWSPDGTRIAYAANPCFLDTAGDPQGGPCVFVMGTDGSAKLNLTPEEKREECDPASQLPGSSHAHHSDNPSWSPDGSQIAYAGYFDICAHASGGASDIWVMNADGSAKRDLMSDQGTPDGEPAWSPAGDRIVFSSDRDGAEGLFAVGVAGGTVTRLTTGQDTEPDWGRPPVPCVVPKVRGSRLGRARRVITAAGCIPGKVKRRRGGRRGRVLASRPGAGRTVPAFSRVRLVVSRR